MNYEFSCWIGHTNDANDGILRKEMELYQYFLEDKNNRENNVVSVTKTSASSE
jgi:hypothetical protein